MTLPDADPTFVDALQRLHDRMHKLWALPDKAEAVQKGFSDLSILLDHFRGHCKELSPLLYAIDAALDAINCAQKWTDVTDMHGRAAVLHGALRGVVEGVAYLPRDLKDADQPSPFSPSWNNLRVILEQLFIPILEIVVQELKAQGTSTPMPLVIPPVPHLDIPMDVDEEVSVQLDAKDKVASRRSHKSKDNKAEKKAKSKSSAKKRARSLSSDDESEEEERPKRKKAKRDSDKDEEDYVEAKANTKSKKADSDSEDSSEEEDKKKRSSKKTKKDDSDDDEDQSEDTEDAEGSDDEEAESEDDTKKKRPVKKNKKRQAKKKEKDLMPTEKALQILSDHNIYGYGEILSNKSKVRVDIYPSRSGFPPGAEELKVKVPIVPDLNFFEQKNYDLSELPTAKVKVADLPKVVFTYDAVLDFDADSQTAHIVPTTHLIMYLVQKEEGESYKAKDVRFRRVNMRKTLKNIPETCASANNACMVAQDVLLQKGLTPPATIKPLRKSFNSKPNILFPELSKASEDGKPEKPISLKDLCILATALETKKPVPERLQHIVDGHRNHEGDEESVEESEQEKPEKESKKKPVDGKKPPAEKKNPAKIIDTDAEEEPSKKASAKKHPVAVTAPDPVPAASTADVVESDADKDTEDKAAAAKTVTGSKQPHRTAKRPHGKFPLPPPKTAMQVVEASEDESVAAAETSTKKGRGKKPYAGNKQPTVA